MLEYWIKQQAQMSDSQAFNHLLNDCIESESEKDPPSVPLLPVEWSTASAQMCVWECLTVVGIPNKRLLQIMGPRGEGRKKGGHVEGLHALEVSFSPPSRFCAVSIGMPFAALFCWCMSVYSFFRI